MECQEVLEKLKSQADPEAVAGMAKFGIKPEKTLGVGMPTIRTLSKEIGKDHKLALELWETGIREARLLAGMVANPKQADEALLESWVKDFNSWDIVDGTCMSLIEKTPFAYQKAMEWSGREEEYVKRAGFVMMARLAVSDKKADDSLFEKFLPVMKQEANDDRNYVKKAVNWALRQVGKRSRYLNGKALEAAEEIKALDTKSARWIASDAFRELTKPATLERLKR
jgi:3-methyladenine DNA glycosylase AlkD